MLFLPLRRRGFRDDVLVELLVVRGKANVNVASLTNNTPLHDACEGLHQAIIQIILQNGVDVEVNAKNIDGYLSPTEDLLFAV